MSEAPWFPPAVDEPQPDEPAAPAPEEFPCPKCDRVLKSRQGLASHLTRSHSVRPATAARRRAPAKAKRLDPAAFDAALLKVLYPDGAVPVSSLAKVQDWLADARRLHGRW